MTPQKVLDFWFADGADTWRQAWFRRDDAFDAAIRTGFGAQVVPAREGAFDAWTTTPEGTLALLILLDQFPRNLFRGSAEAFASDAKARAVASALVAAQGDLALTPMQRTFAYLPFEHGETMGDQNRSVALFEGLRDDKRHAAPGAGIDYAWRHWHVIRTFGRFPHRNAALGRANTAAEQAWLASGGGF